MRKARRRRRTARALGEKRAIIVTGAPGTGKSVVALQVVGAAAREGHAVAHATGSKAFTTNLRGIVRRSEVFRYFNNFIKTADSSIDLIVCDEAHRLRETSGTRWNKGTGRPQVGEIIDTAKVAVFFLDHRQSVRGNEIGSVGLIQEYAGRSDVPFSTYDLTTEFRCAGSESYIRWVDYLFGLRDNRSLAWKHHDEYEVRIFDDVREMEGALRQRMSEGCSARLVAGFCWPWSDPNEDGSLVPDVTIGNWARPWNRKPKDMWRRRKGSSESPATHPYKIWATTDAGFDQVGCIYSAQGFEFDYVGLIVGRDLRWDPVNSRWVADLRQNEDVGFKSGLPSKDMAVDKLKQIYRVLATRGMKGTYLYFLDETTRHHVDCVGAGL